MTPRLAYLALLVAAPLALALPPTASQAQTPPPVDFDLMQAPPSPAYVLLGIEPASVERPGDPTDLGVSIMNATDKLSVLPQNYAVGFAPFWLFGGGRKVTFDQWRRNGSLITNLLQTADLSAAAASVELGGGQSDLTSLGVGLRFSLWRGHVPDDEAEPLAELEKELLTAARSADERLRALAAADTLLIALEAAMRQVARVAPDSIPMDLIDAIALRNQQLADQAEQSTLPGRYARLKQLAAAVDLTRVGFKLDVAGGITGDFPGREFQAGRIGRGGAWITAGHESRRWSTLVVARWLATNVQGGDNATSYDAGGRLIYDGTGRLDLSAEFLGRWYVGDAALEDTWRASVMADVDVGFNKTLSFSFGRDFEGGLSGNLVAAVQFILGFGSSRAGGVAGS